MEKENKYYVYILYSSSKKKYYTGQTQDINLRLYKHNKGEVKSTKNGFPWKLIHYFGVATRGEAVVLERKIKGRGAKRFLTDKNILGV